MGIARRWGHFRRREGRLFVHDRACGLVDLAVAISECLPVCRPRQTVPVTIGGRIRAEGVLSRPTSFEDVVRHDQSGFPYASLPGVL